MKINIVLFQPEIPHNTANIMRTCVAVDATLHLIKPYGFDLSKKNKILRRNSTNFIDEVELKEYDTFEEFEVANKVEHLYLLTRYGKSIHTDIKNRVTKDDEVFLMFGKESTGIDKEIVKKYLDNSFRIPMSKKMRSINLSNCVALCAYDVLSIGGFEGLELEETHQDL